MKNSIIFSSSTQITVCTQVFTKFFTVFKGFDGRVKNAHLSHLSLLTQWDKIEKKKRSAIDLSVPFVSFFKFLKSSKRLFLCYWVHLDINEKKIHEGFSYKCTKLHFFQILSPLCPNIIFLDTTISPGAKIDFQFILDSRGKIFFLEPKIDNFFWILNDDLDS